MGAVEKEWKFDKFEDDSPSNGCLYLKCRMSKLGRLSCRDN